MKGRGRQGGANSRVTDLRADGDGPFGGITWDLMILELWLQKNTDDEAVTAPRAYA